MSLETQGFESVEPLKQSEAFKEIQELERTLTIDPNSFEKGASE